MKHPPPPIKQVLTPVRTEVYRNGRTVRIEKEDGTYDLKRVESEAKIYVVEPREAPCKDCKKEPRQNGSSRGKNCSESFRHQQFEVGRLQRKIEQQKTV